MPKRWDFKRYERNLRKAKRDIPNEVGREAVKHFKESFDMGRFNGGNSRWKQRKSSRLSHKLMNKSGDLKRSLKVKSANFRKVHIIADSDYATIHNQGGKTWNGGLIPQRRFMGSSRKLTKRIQSIINKHLKKVFR